MKTNGIVHLGPVLDAYREIIDATAVYLDAGTGSALALAYTGLGLAGEASEALEKSAASSLCDRSGPAFADFRAELGDTLWYVAAMHRELRAATSDTWAMVLDGHGGDPSPRPVEALVIAAGRVAEAVKRIIRDDGGAVSAARSAQLRAGLAVVLRQWIAIHEALDIEVRDTIECNAHKLLARRDNGVLTGSGDRR